MIAILHPHRDASRIDRLRTDGFQFIDGWNSALPELRALARFDESAVIDTDDLDSVSRYIVYPWRRTIVRLPEDKLFHQLRTARNRYLITNDEQRQWSTARIAVAGLSVGASVLHVCALTGARNFRIADPDTLGPTNLNRLAGSVCDLGTPKATLAYRRLVEADPYTDVETFSAGYTPERAHEFLGSGPRRARVVLEEMDDLAMKVDLRTRARDAGIPVVMVTDDGDDVILDVERYDLDRHYPLFHGRADDIAQLDAESLRNPANRIEIAKAIVGQDVSPRTHGALGEVGHTIGSWPQLGTAASLAGVVGALVAREIVCGADVPSGRCHVEVSRLISPAGAV